MALRKRYLTSPLVFNCGSQQLNNVIIVKYKLETAETTGRARLPTLTSLVPDAIVFVPELQRHNTP
jgi:hypothetical protein